MSFGSDIPSSSSAGLRAEVKRMRVENDDLRKRYEETAATLASTQIAWEDWKVRHSTVRLEVEIERLRALLKEAFLEVCEYIEVGYGSGGTCQSCGEYDAHLDSCLVARIQEALK